MAKFSERLRLLRSEHSLSLSEFAKIIGCAKSTVNMYELGEREPSFERLELIADYFNVDMDFLLGKSDVRNRYAWVIEMNKQAAKVDAKQIDQLPPGCLPAPKFVKKPRLGAIACGKPVLAVEDADMFDFVPEDVECDFTLRCNGDSMVGARIHDGDIVLIKKQDIVEDGEIAAVLIGDETTLKRVYYDRENNVLQLFAENPMYKTMRFTGHELDNIRILGKAVAFLSAVR